ncbi:MAG: threonine synthase [Deltaproteobacteria bacterium]|nr:MAG: threonine synthase [Deltaproteobacteria bacterium]
MTTALIRGLKCRECGAPYDPRPVHVCELCFGPLEVDYDYDAIAAAISRDAIAARPPTMWRYAELLPCDVPDRAPPVGFTPLVRARRLAEHLGVRELWIKNDAVCFPTLSFKDRVVAIAIAKALDFGFERFACASTGNLANAVAAAAAAAGVPAYVFVPHDLEPHKVLGTLVYGATVVGIRGTYDEVNRLCAEIGDRYPFGFANINLRPFYAEGSKTLAFEAAEQLGWRTPDHVVSPMAGGSLITKIRKAWTEMRRVGLLDEDVHTRIHGAQAAGCAPIVEAVHAGRDLIKPVKQPATIARSLAIGNPADGYYAVQTIRATGGWAAAPTDDQILAAIRLLAETEGIFTETAGGVTLAATRQLIDEGRIGRDESVLVCITGQGLKTMDPLVETLPKPPVIAPSLAEFDAITKER